MSSTIPASAQFLFLSKPKKRQSNFVNGCVGVDLRRENVMAGWIELANGEIMQQIGVEPVGPTGAEVLIKYL